ncbi:MAG: hypothetical protein Q8N52_05805, partial [Acidobacteriota bacterium]|nr:hypothetical protein [Acidobacteriota bacterium]
MTQIGNQLRSAFAFGYRLARRFALVIGIVVAVVVVSTLTIDLGPALRARAETAGGNWLERKMTIGRLGVHLARGRFVIEDLRIDGMLPGEPPWLTAKRIEVSLTWGALFGREVLLDEIEMTDWRMVIESFPDGRQTFPRVTGPPRAPRTGPGLVVTTLQYVRAHRGELVVNDYGSDWFMVAPNLDVTVAKVGTYRGTMKFNDGDLKIQNYVPMKAELAAAFKLADGKIVFERIDLVTDGAVSQISGVIEPAKWPEQLYQVKSRMQFPRMREIFFANDTFSLSGEGFFN